MLVAELQEILRHRESSFVEWKRDDVHPDSLAKEVAALANLEGGRILLGVEDDGTVTGLTRGAAQAEEWAMNVCRGAVQPPVVATWETVLLDDGRTVGVLVVPTRATERPYLAAFDGDPRVFVRAGSVTREATPEEAGSMSRSARLWRETEPDGRETKPPPDGSGVEGTGAAGARASA